MSDAVRIPVIVTEIVRVPTGQPGSPGASAYDVAVANGFVGTEAEWLASLQGEDGAPGPSAVSADAGNAATLGTDSLIFVDGTDFASAAQGALADTAVQPGDLGDLATQDTVTVSQVQISGTPDGTKFLRDDGSWQNVAGGGDAAWGGITGTLTDQADLAAALDGKATAAQGALADTAVQPADLDAYVPETRTVNGNALSSDVVLDTTDLADFNTATDARVAAGITGKLDTTAAPELIRDTMGTALVAGTNITITPNDGADTITISAAGGGGGGSDADVAGYIADGGSDTREALDVLYAPIPIPNTATVGGTAGTASGGTFASVSWSVTAASPLILQEIRILPTATTTIQFVVGGVAVSSTPVTNGVVATLPAGVRIPSGTTTLTLNYAANSAARHNGSGSAPKVYTAPDGTAFTANSWVGFSGFELSVQYVLVTAPVDRYATAAPTSGDWARGSTVWNSAPSASGYIGWVCVVAGSPGTWRGFGAIQA